jgi:hypothetical protein
MRPGEKPVPFSPAASEYILDNFEAIDRLAMLISTVISVKPSSASPTRKKPRAPDSRPGCATRTRTAQTSMLRGIELAFVLPFAASECFRKTLGTA